VKSVEIIDDFAVRIISRELSRSRQPAHFCNAAAKYLASVG